MRIVFIASYFPPMNSTGARRVTAFSRHVAGLGHDVLVITPTKRPQHGALTELWPDGVRVLELPTPTVVEAAPAPEGGRDHSVSRLGRLQKLLGRLVVRLFGQLVERDLLFVRDMMRDPRVQEEVRQADAMVSTSPPWVTHLAARLLARRWGTPWIADYRDQFSNCHLVHATWISRKIEVLIDRSFVRRNQATVVVSPTMLEYYRRWDPATRLIYNGFEPDRVQRAREWAADRPRRDDDPYVLRYVGSYIRDYPPRELLAALESLGQKTHFRLEAVGAGSEDLEEYVRVSAPTLVGKVVGRPQVGADEALRLMATADCLVLLESWDRASDSQRGVVTTKVFEYVALGRPVIAAVEPGIDAVRIVRDAGLLAAASLDPAVLGRAVRSLLDGSADHVPDASAIGRYSRLAQAQQLEALIEEVAAAAPRRAEVPPTNAGGRRS